jgi:hypothetical protein
MDGNRGKRREAEGSGGKRREAEGSGGKRGEAEGSGHITAQEDAALVAEGYEFEGPCSLMVSVNESYAVVLEGQEEGEVRHDLMGVHEHMESKEGGGRGVWQAVGGIGCFLFYSQKKWMVSGRESMEAGSGRTSTSMRVNSTTTAPGHTGHRGATGALNNLNAFLSVLQE